MPGVAGASACRHPTRLLTPMRRENRIRITAPAKEGPIKFLAPMVTPRRSAVLLAANQRRQFLVPVVVGGQQVRLVWADNRSPRDKGSAVTGRIAAFTPPKGARALLPAANNGGKGAGPFHPARSWR